MIYLKSPSLFPRLRTPRYFVLFLLLSPRSRGVPDAQHWEEGMNKWVSEVSSDTVILENEIKTLRCEKPCLTNRRSFKV